MLWKCRAHSPIPPYVAPVSRLNRYLLQKPIIIAAITYMFTCDFGGGSHVQAILTGLWLEGKMETKTQQQQSSFPDKLAHSPIS